MNHAEAQGWTAQANTFAAVAMSGLISFLVLKAATPSTPPQAEHQAARPPTGAAGGSLLEFSSGTATAVDGGVVDATVKAHKAAFGSLAAAHAGADSFSAVVETECRPGPQGHFVAVRISKSRPALAFNIVAAFLLGRYAVSEVRKMPARP